MDIPPPMKKAIAEALKSTFRYRLGAVVVRQGKIVGRGYNERRYHKYAGYYNWNNTLHAEASAILRTPSSLLDGSTIYVARVNENGQPLLARPCACCFNLLEYVGIRRVFYSIPCDPFIESWELNGRQPKRQSQL